jgi:hypothetical protein
MKKYEQPTIEITHVVVSMLMASPNTVNPKRDNWDPAGGGMSNSSIWDNTDESGGNGE